MNHNLESTLEKIARVLARQFNIEVTFEGNQAYTDGKRIVLPFFNEVTPELFADLNGYLDHEVSHVLFTEFPEAGKVLTHFHKELLNAVEDIRIEREMIKKYPGTEYHIKPLRDKLMGPKAQEDLKQHPWPVRLLFSIQWMMEGRKFIPDTETARHLEFVKDEIEQLNSCTDTRSLRLVTEEICRKIKKDREEEKKEAGEENKSSSKSDKSSKKESKSSSGDSKSDKKEKSDKSGDKSEKSDKKSESDSSKSKGEKSEEKESKKSEPQAKADAKASAAKEKDDSMLEESTGNPSSSFDKYELDVHRMINKEIKKQIKTEQEKPDYKYGPRGTKKASLPTTTRFDKEHDHSGKGNLSVYSSLKKTVNSLVNPLKQNLERILKSEENARWRPEMEQGLIDSRNLAKWASNNSYRQVFKQKVKNETDNVAVSILIDLSGSMGGEGKIETARETAIAMSEALKGLGIEFEVTGFHSEYDNRLADYSRSLGDISRFTRQCSTLEHEIFKSFSSASLTGLTQISAGGNNDDGECVFWAAKRLSARKEKRKVLIVLSDGMPASDADHYTLQNDLRGKLEIIEKAGIETVGIGIKTDAVKHFYKDYIVVNTVSDLTKTCMNKLMKILTKNVGKAKVAVAA